MSSKNPRKGGQKKAAQEELEDTIELHTAWVGLEETPILAANQALSQFQNDTFFVTLGVMVPPVLLGTTEQKRAQAEALTYVPVKTLGRFALSPKAMEELVKVLRDNLQRYRKRKKTEEGS